MSVNDLSCTVLVDLNGRGLFTHSQQCSFQGLKQMDPRQTHSIHAVHLGEAAFVAKEARPRVRAVMAEVAGQLSAVAARAADQVARLVAQGGYLGRAQTLAVIEIAVCILAIARQMIPVAKVHAAQLSAVLERLDRGRVWLGQRDVHALIVLVELVKGARGSRPLVARNVDGHRGGASAHGSVAALLRLGLAGGQGGRGRWLRRRARRRGGGTDQSTNSRRADDRRRRDGGGVLVKDRRRRHGRKTGGRSHRPGRDRLGPEDGGECNALERKLSEIGSRRRRL